MQFSQIIGQEAIKKRLIQTVHDNRVSHAQLFLGPEGSGKLALAIAYAQYINCEQRIAEDSCGHCPSCLKYNKLIHPDLHFIYPVATTKKVSSKPLSKHFIVEWRELLLENNQYVALNDWYNKIEIENKQGFIKDEDSKEIIKTLSYKSYESEYKVMILWMVEKLYHTAAPRILKILEEPPDKTLFILISESQDQIIQTILSRTQLVKIPKLPDDEIFNTIKDRYELPDNKVRDVVNLSNGNFREAIQLINQNEDSTEHFNTFRLWMRLCYQVKIIEISKFVEKISKTGREPQKRFVKYAMRMIRECLLFQFGLESLVKLNSEEQKFISDFSPFVNVANADLFAEELNKAIYHIERNANPTILFFDLSIKVARLLKLGSAK